MGESLPMLMRSWALAGMESCDNIAADRTNFLIIDFFLLWTVFLNDKVVDDEVLTLHRVLAHIIFQQLLYLVILVEGYLLQADIRTYEAGKLLWRNLTQTLESGDFWVGT
jgi:hypothetical protein